MSTTAPAAPTHFSAMPSGDTHGTTKKKPINLLRGWPSPSLLPTQALSRATHTALTTPSISSPALLYGPDPGYEPLRGELARWLGAFYGPWRRKLAADATQSEEGGGGGGGDAAAGVEGAERIAVTGGASQSVACILQSYTDPGVTRAVWMVAPCYFLACPIFADAGFAGRLRSVPEDDGGIDVAFLERGMLQMEGERSDGGEGKGEGMRGYKEVGPHRKVYRHLVYVVPSFANPSGLSMGLERRRRLVEVARRFDALVVCDDVYDMLQWPISPFPSSSTSTPSTTTAESTTTMALLPRLVDIDALSPPDTQGGKNFGHVVSNGSFSKLVGPGLRTGWTESTADFAAGLAMTGSTRSGGAASQFGAAVLCEMLRGGELDGHIAWLRGEYGRRWGVMMGAVGRVLVPLGVRVRWDTLGAAEGEKKEGGNGVYGGYFVWLTLPEGSPPAKVVAERCRVEENLAVAGGELFDVHGDDASGITFERNVRLCFAWEDEEVLVEGVERLGRVLAGLLAEGERGGSRSSVGASTGGGADEFK